MPRRIFLAAAFGAASVLVVAQPSPTEENRRIIERLDERVSNHISTHEMEVRVLSERLATVDRNLGAIDTSVESIESKINKFFLTLAVGGVLGGGGGIARYVYRRNGRRNGGG